MDRRSKDTYRSGAPAESGNTTWQSYWRTLGWIFVGDIWVHPAGNGFGWAMNGIGEWKEGKGQRITWYIKNAKYRIKEVFSTPVRKDS